MKRERKKKENELTLVNCVDGHQKKVVFTFISLKSHGAFQKSSYLCIVKRIKRLAVRLKDNISDLRITINKQRKEKMMNVLAIVAFAAAVCTFVVVYGTYVGKKINE